MSDYLTVAHFLGLEQGKIVCEQTSLFVLLSNYSLEVQQVLKSVEYF
jgi:hypothetical protein